MDIVVIDKVTTEFSAEPGRSSAEPTGQSTQSIARSSAQLSKLKIYHDGTSSSGACRGVPLICRAGSGDSKAGKPRRTDRSRTIHREAMSLTSYVCLEDQCDPFSGHCAGIVTLRSGTMT